MKKVFPFLFILAIFSACTDKHHVDLSNIDISYKVVRFDSLILRSDINNSSVYYENLYKEYPEFMQIFCEQLFRLGTIDPDSFNLSNALDYLASDQSTHELFKETNKIQDQLQEVQTAIDQALHYYAYHFPKDSIPDLYFYNGRFEYAAVVGVNCLGIAQEMCLGPEHPFIQQSGIPKYITRKLDTEHMPIHVMNNLVSSNYPQTEGNNLLDFMIYNGKVLYCLDALFPDTEDSIKIGYPAGKIEWCIENEGEVWAWLMKHDLLYSAQQGEFLKFTLDGPNTAGMPAEAPGNIASWLGWQIVRQYMDKFPETSLYDLMTAPGIRRGEDLMLASGYRPS